MSIKEAEGSLHTEFCDGQQIRLLFGLSRTHAYALARKGVIRSVSLKKPGSTRGRRLFDCASIRAFLNSNAANK
jgi:hypothetical protein